MCMYIYIYIYIRERDAVETPFLAYAMLEYSPFASARRYICWKHQVWTKPFRLGHIHVFKLIRCFAWRNSTLSMHIFSRKDQWVTNKHRNNKNQIRKPRFQDQWVAKIHQENPKETTFQDQWIATTIEKTRQIKKHKMSRPMGSQSHWEKQQNQTHQNFRIDDSGSQPLVLKSCFVLTVVVLSMALAAHWSWNLGFLVMSLKTNVYGSGYPWILESWFSCLFVFSMVLAPPVVFTLVSLWFSRWLSIAELHAPHELQHVLKSLPREWCSRLHESMCFKISVLVQTRTHFPIVVIFVSCRWCSRLGESIISMSECGHIVLRMMLSPARGHMLFNTCVIVREFLI